MSFEHVKVGDVVIRMLAGSIPMEMRVSAVSAERIECGPWWFDPVSGAEIDEDLGWGAPPLHTGSYLVEA